MLEKKILLLFFLFIGQLFFPVVAQQRSYSQVVEIANRHFTSSTLVRSMTFGQGVNVIPASRVLQPRTRATGQNGEPFYFVESSGSFVIVSGDERMKPVLGYSDGRTYSTDQLPAHIQTWLSVYAGEYAYLQTNPSLNTESVQSFPQTGGLLSSVSPLLNVAWSQNAPFNDLCPLYNGKRSVTGCVATAMAMVMKYHEYPAQGKGSSKYSKVVDGVTVNVDVNFEDEPFGWEEMSSSNTSAKNHAMAWLMACCGAAVQMTYSDLISSASTRSAAKALVNNFGYDAGLEFFMRDNYLYADFLAIIKKELSAKRPIIVDAFSEGPGGHCFVFDGYDKDDLIHVNWGWGGGMNGYYELTSMNPGYSGPGSSIGGYNVDMMILTKIQKPTSDLQYISHFSAIDGLNLNTSSVTRTGTFTVSSGVCLNQTASFTGNFQPCLFQNGKFVTTLGSPIRKENIAFAEGFFPVFENISIPSMVNNGDYQLYIATKDDRETAWQVVDMPRKETPYYVVKVTSDKIDFVNPINRSLVKFVSLTQEHELYQNLGSHFFITVKNESSEWLGRVGVLLKAVDRPNEDAIVIAQDRVVFEEGQKTFELVNDILLNVPAGQYYLQPATSTDGVIWNVLAGEQKVITVHEKPGNDFKLAIVSTELNRQSLTEKDTLKGTITVKNTGKDPYDGKIQMHLDKGYYQGSIFRQIAFIEPGETKTFQLKGDNSVPDGDYTVSFSYYWAFTGNNKFGGVSYECSIRTLTGGKK